MRALVFLALLCSCQVKAGLNSKESSEEVDGHLQKQCDESVCCYRWEYREGIWCHEKKAGER